MVIIPVKIPDVISSGTSTRGVAKITHIDKSRRSANDASATQFAINFTSHPRTVHKQSFTDTHSYHEQNLCLQ